MSCQIAMFLVHWKISKSYFNLGKNGCLTLSEKHVNSCFLLNKYQILRFDFSPVVLIFSPMVLVFSPVVFRGKSVPPWFWGPVVLWRHKIPCRKCQIRWSISGTVQFRCMAKYWTVQSDTLEIHNPSKKIQTNTITGRSFDSAQLLFTAPQKSISMHSPYFLL